MIIFVALKANLQEFGEFSSVCVEKCYTDKFKAEEYISPLPKNWTEEINGVKYICERSICEVELE